MISSYVVLMCTILFLGCGWQPVWKRDEVHITHSITPNPHIRWKYPIVENLDRLISPYGYKQCLVTVDNFRLVDLYEISFPIILRSLAQLSLKQPGKTRGIIVFGPKNLAPRNISNMNGSFDCPISNYLLGLSGDQLSFKDICYRLEMPKYWSHTKPWNCFVQIALYPQEFYFIHFGWNKWNIFYEGAVSSFLYTFPASYQFSLQIFVHEQPPLSECCYLQNYNRYAQRITLGSPVTLCGNLFLVITTRLLLPRKLQPAIAIIDEIHHLSVCHRWSLGLGAMLDPSDISDFRFLSRISLPPKKFELMWIIGAVHTSDNYVNRMVRIFHDCWRKPPLNEVFEYTHPIQKLALAYAHIWYEIMGNHTIIVDSKDGLGGCYTGQWRNIMEYHISLEFHSYSPELYHFPYFVQDALTSLTFISCGEKRYNSILFEELISIFDSWTWIFLAVFSGAIVIPLRSLSEVKNMQINKHWMSPLKVLLEQGNPFSDTVANDYKLKYMIGGFLLMGIVLSNAYKNTNVYNMILPRKPIPYEFFHELVASNYTIYSRTASLTLNGYMGNRTPKADKMSYQYYITDDGKFDMLVLSELAVFLGNLQNAAKTLYVVTNKEQLLTVNSTLQRSSLLHVAGLFSSFNATKANVEAEISKYVQTVPSWLFTWNGVRQIGKDEEANIMKQESTTLKSRLHECNQIALILPRYMCQNHSSRITDAFVGKAFISDVQWLFTLNGAVPPYIPQRIKTTHESGMWQRWSKFVEKHTVAVGSNEALTAASMEGNIVVIFCVLLCGLMGGIISFFLETWLIHLFRYSFSCFCNLRFCNKD